MRDKNYYKKYIDSFLKQNSMVNLVSKNDANLLFEKHISDSLAIEKFFEKHIKNTRGLKLLDIGTGGGFPAVPTAITYPEIEVFALDSIRKKINAIENIKNDLDIKNLHTICERAENITEKYDIITSRAVSSLKVISNYALPLLKNDGYFIAYKSIRTEEEINDAKPILKKYKSEIIDLIEYQLPLLENYTRKLVIIKRQ